MRCMWQRVMHQETVILSWERLTCGLGNCDTCHKYLDNRIKWEYSYPEDAHLCFMKLQRAYECVACGKMLGTRNDLRQRIRFITKLGSRPRSKDHRPTMTSFSQLSVELKTMVFSYLDRPTDCHSCWDPATASLVSREWGSWPISTTLGWSIGSRGARGSWSASSRAAASSG